MNTAILVEGPDALKFLQGQLTCDMNLLSKDHSLQGAHCNLKGRVEALYEIELQDQGILLITPADVIAHALDKLQFYARFSKVKLSIVSVAQAVPQTRPRLHPETLGRYLPQELGLDQTEAISFSKGCYLGQEIVARLHYLGKLKKELLQVKLDQTVRPGETLQHPQWGEIEVVDCEAGNVWILKANPA